MSFQKLGFGNLRVTPSGPVLIGDHICPEEAPRHEGRHSIDSGVLLEFASAVLAKRQVDRSGCALSQFSVIVMPRREGRHSISVSIRHEAGISAICAWRQVDRV